MINSRYQHLSYETGETNIPLLLYNMGIITQKKIIRLDGFQVMHLFVNQSGSGKFQMLQSGKEWTLEKNEACLLPARVPHTYFPMHDTPWILGFVTISGKILNELLESMQLPLMRPIALSTTDTIWPLFDSLFQLLRENSADLNWTLSAQLYQLLLETRRQSSLYRESPSLQTKDSSTAVKLAAEMIRAHYNEPLLLADYAQSLGYTVQHLNRLFKQAYGQTMHQYLENVRFEKCLQLLQQDMSVQDVASTLGMEANYFIRAFKRVHGVTPGRYRQLAKPASPDPR